MQGMISKNHPESAKLQSQETTQSKMSFSLNKIRSFLPGQSSSNQQLGDVNKKRHSVCLEPEVGFQLVFEANATTSNENDSNRSKTQPELVVHLLAARHLPSTFGFKMVHGYDIKVKLFPGSRKFDSKIQTNSWPKFNESFRFPLIPDIKSSMKRQSIREKSYTGDKLPENLFSGHFVVFTVYAHLELPAGGFNRFNKTYRSLRDKGTTFLQKVADSSITNSKTKDECSTTKPKTTDGDFEIVPQMTKSEAKRNLGSVTCYLDPKIFRKNPRTGLFATDEFWLPIKDITTTPKNSVSDILTAPKGQIEITLELCDRVSDTTPPDSEIGDNQSTNNDTPPTPNNPTKSFKRQWSISEVKRKIKNGKSFKADNDLALKVTTSKMRSSIKVKDVFESSAGSIYVKTTVFLFDVHSNSWKSDTFLPTLSTRWNPDESTVVVPLKNLDNLNDYTIRTTIATKTKVGKKIVLGTVVIGSTSTVGSALEHWRNAISNKNQPVAAWHNFQ